MKYLKGIVLSASMAFITTAQANWLVKVEDDVINDAKSAILIGNVDDAHSLVFDCDSNSLAMVFLEEGKWKEGMRGRQGKLVVKVDKNEKKTFSVELYQRNDKFLGLKTNDEASIKPLLTQIKNATNRVLVGFYFEDTGSKWTGEADVYSSSRAVEKFTSGCGIKL